MKKTLSTLFGYLLTPALLAGHYLTGNEAFLFVYGLAAASVIAFYAIAVAVLIASGDGLTSDAHATFVSDCVKARKELTAFKEAVSWSYQLGAFCYLAWAGAFGCATLCFIVGALTVTWISILKGVAKKGQA